MVTRLKNGKIAVDAQDSFDGNMKKFAPQREEWTDGTYQPEKNLADQLRHEKAVKAKIAALNKMKKASYEINSKRALVESRMNAALQRKEAMQGPSETQKVLAAYHMRNKALGETQSDFGPMYDLSQASVHDVYSVTPVKGENYGPAEYYTQDYNYQTSPDYQTLTNRFADGVQFNSPIGIKIADYPELYVENHGDKQREFEKAASLNQQQSEFNYTEDEMVNDIVAAEAAKKSVVNPLTLLIAAIVYFVNKG